MKDWMWKVWGRENSQGKHQVSGLGDLMEDITVFPETEILEGKIPLGNQNSFSFEVTLELERPKE